MPLPSCRRRTPVLVLGCLVGLLAGAAAAPPASAAADSVEEMITRGVQLRRGGDDEGAAREFQKAYDQSHSPRAAAQLGLAEQALGRWADADTHVAEALSTTGDPWVEKNRGVLNGALGIIKGHIGRIEISASVPGALVSINGRPAGAVPLPGAVKVSAGTSVVRAEAPGYAPAAREIKVGAGEYVPVMLTLDPVGATGAAAGGPAGGGPALVGGGAAAGAGTQAPVWKRPWFWAVTGAGVLAAVVVVLVATRSTYDQSVDVRLNGN
jgi:PEGA domain